MLVGIFAALEIPTRISRRHMAKQMPASWTARAKRRLWWPYRIWQVSYIGGMIALNPWGGLILLAMYSCYCIGSTRGYGDGLEEGRADPEELAREVKAQLVRDWPGMVSQAAARAARDN